MSARKATKAGQRPAIQKRPRPLAVIERELAKTHQRAEAVKGPFLKACERFNALKEEIDRHPMKLAAKLPDLRLS